MTRIPQAGPVSRLRDIPAICRPHMGRTVGAALVVGTILFAINHLNEVLEGKTTVVTWLKTGLTYLVPFLVSNFGVVTASRHRDRSLRAPCQPVR